MNRSKKINGLLLTLCIISVFIFAGCGEEKSGNTISEPEITADYLDGEYADQLINDGAGTMLGTVSVEQSGDSYIAHVTEKEVVPSSDTDDGYYIADTNVSKDIALGQSARMTCMVNGEQKVVTIDEFIKQSSKDPDQIYTIYMMGDSVELMLATDPADVIIK